MQGTATVERSRGLIALQEVVVMTELEEALILTHLEIEFRWLIIFYHQYIVEINKQSHHTYCIF